MELWFLDFATGSALKETSDALRDAVYFFKNPTNRDLIHRLRRVTKRFIGDRAAECYYVIFERINELLTEGEPFFELFALAPDSF